MGQIKEVIELMEKAIDWCQRAPNGIPVGILLSLDQALAILRTEQPPAGEPISLERQNEILFEANRNIKARLDRSEADLKKKDELLFAYESVRAPKPKRKR